MEWHIFKDKEPYNGGDFLVCRIIGTGLQQMFVAEWCENTLSWISNYSNDGMVMELSLTFDSNDLWCEIFYPKPPENNQHLITIKTKYREVTF